MSYVVEFCFLLMLMLHYLGTSGCCLSSNPGWLLLLQEWNMSRLTGFVKVVRCLLMLYTNTNEARDQPKKFTGRNREPIRHPTQSCRSVRKLNWISDSSEALKVDLAALDAIEISSKSFA